MGAEGLEVRDDKFLAEGLREQNDVALDAPRVRGEGESSRVSNTIRCFLVRLQHHSAIKLLRW